MPWTLVLSLVLWDTCTAAIRFIPGEYLSCLPRAISVSEERQNFEHSLASAESSCTWSCFPCSTRPEATSMTTCTSMNFSKGGSKAIHSKSFMQPSLPSTHLTFGLPEHGVLKPTLHWLMSFGNPRPSDDSAAVHPPWIPSTSRAPSQKAHLDPKSAPGRICLGKHLRARRLKPQARRRPRYRRSCKPKLPWRRQVYHWTNAKMADRCGWMTLCAHWLAIHHRALLLQVVVPLMQHAATRCAFTQALRGSSTKILPTPLHSTWRGSPGPHVTGLDQPHTPPALSYGPPRFRPLRVDCTSCLHVPTTRLGFPSHSLLPRSLCFATMDPLRDPLHDSVLEETVADSGPTIASTAMEAAHSATSDGAAADAGEEMDSDAGSALSTLTAALAEADRSPSADRGPGPHGPPPPVHPLARQVLPGLIPSGPPAVPAGFLGYVHRHRRAASTPAGSSSSARGPPAAPPMPGEPDDPHWQRVLAVNVLNTLQHTGPAFVHAPTLATVKSWSSLRIILEEATEMDEICCQRVDPQDLNNPLHMGDHSGDGMAGDDGQEEAEEEPLDAAEDGEEEEEASSQDEDPSNDPDGPDHDGSTGPAATSTGLEAPGLALMGPDSEDPLHMIHSITTATASENPLSTRPGDWVYEANDVSFNLSAAHRCLEATRRTVAALRDGNRHRSGSGGEAPRSSSRSRSPQRDSDMADRRGVTQNTLQHVLLALPSQIPLTSQSGETLDPHPLKPGSSTRDLHSHSALPMRKNLWPSAASALPASGATESPAAYQPLQSMIIWMHRYSRIASQAQPGPMTSQARSFCLQAVDRLHLLAHRLSWCLHWCLETLEAALMALWSTVVPASKPRSPTAGASQISASPSNTTCSRPGPNSRGSPVCRMQQLIILICLHPACAGSRAEARVAAHATEAAGGTMLSSTDLPASMPKLGGFPTTTRPPPTAPVRRCAKRAFRRACHRAVLFGRTKYKGRDLLASEIPQDQRRPCPVSRDPHKPSQSRPSTGIQVMTWNAGGLGGGVYDELLTHLSASTIDVAVIQESRWTECMEYTSGPWTCVHSGCKTRRHAGLLVLMHSRLVAPSQVRFEHLLKGRLLHVRVPLQSADRRHLHIIAIYQKTHDPSDKSAPQQRQQVWNSLHQCLNRLPARDSIVLLGDFNTPLRAFPPHVGSFVGSPLSHPPDDIPDLEVLMQSHKLTALNSWYKPQDGVHTFSFGKAKTQIDYIMVRQTEASTQARRVFAHHHFKVGAARQGGAFHIPLQTTLSLSRPYWVHSGQRPRESIDQEALLQAIDHPHMADNLHKLAAIRHTVIRHMAQHDDLAGVQTLHTALFDACCRVFPSQKTVARTPPWQTSSVQEGIKSMWAKWRAFKQVRKQGLRGWFQAWRAWKAFDKHYREHQRRCKQARRNVLLDAMQEAEQHAATNNTRGIHQIIKRLAPKQARRRMQLRGPEGQMLPPAEELALLEHHFSSRFQATNAQDCAMASKQWSCREPIEIHAATLCAHILQVPRRKAVPAGHPPSATWRICADLLSPWLCNTLRNTWHSAVIEVPQVWANVDLALVPKPEKSGREPKDYRPIGLACPLGKKKLGAIIQPYVTNIIRQVQVFPQFAYQQGRSQLAALRRVFQHCASAREGLQLHTRNLHLRFAGHKPTPLFGALMVAVDLTQAAETSPLPRAMQARGAR